MRLEGEAGEQFFELDEIARIGARRMLMTDLKTQADDYVERHREERDETERALVVHNGRSQGAKLILGTGTVELWAPRVNGAMSTARASASPAASHPPALHAPFAQGGRGAAHPVNLVEPSTLQKEGMVEHCRYL